MERLKLRKVKNTDERYFHYIVLDTVKDILKRSREDERYAFAIPYRDEYNGKLKPLDDIHCVENGIELCSDDHFRKLSLGEYILASSVLRKDGFVFNRKKNELIKKGR
jgi:hypothetical protein